MQTFLIIFIARFISNFLTLRGGNILTTFSAALIVSNLLSSNFLINFDCSLKKSAYRRYIDIKKEVPLKKVLQNLRKRRIKDRNRKHSALKKHKKAVLIRSDLLSKQRMVLKMAKEIDKVIKKNKN